jgi:uncharacterized protein YkwD
MRQIVGLVLAGLVAVRPGPAAAAGEDPAADLAREVELTNAARQQAGLEPLTLSPQLSAAAQSYTQVLASGACFDHTCGELPNFADRIGQAGYTGWTALAENIAAGYPSPEAVVAGWLASPGHRANILSPWYTEIGVGVVSGGRYGAYWTQDFGSRGGTSVPAAGPPPQEEADETSDSPDSEDGP